MLKVVKQLSVSALTFKKKALVLYTKKEMALRQKCNNKV